MLVIEAKTVLVVSSFKAYVQGRLFLTLTRGFIMSINLYEVSITANYPNAIRSHSYIESVAAVNRKKARRRAWDKMLAKGLFSECCKIVKNGIHTALLIEDL